MSWISQGWVGWVVIVLSGTGAVILTSMLVYRTRRRRRLRRDVEYKTAATQYDPNTNPPSSSASQSRPSTKTLPMLPGASANPTP